MIECFYRSIDPNCAKPHKFSSYFSYIPDLYQPTDFCFSLITFQSQIGAVLYDRFYLFVFFAEECL